MNQLPPSNPKKDSQPNRKNDSSQRSDSNEKGAGDKNEMEWTDEDNKSTREVDITIFTYILN